jgi:GrpB-like predicted nucleotidyltransferase (UPF0157 family)
MTIVVVPYDPAWPGRFQGLRRRIWPVVADVAESIEHVGSTSVPGLAAKPVIDIDVIVPSAAEVPLAIERLATIGYEHLGDLTVTGREAFQGPPRSIEHHLYVCPAGVLSLRNHLALRDHLRAHPDAAAAYGALKLKLASETDDIDVYIAGKTDLVASFLAAEGLQPDELAVIAGINRPERA